MPALPSPGTVLRFQLYHNLVSDAKAGVRMFWSYTGSAPSASAVQALATTMGIAAGANLAAMLATTNTMSFGLLQDLSSNTGNSAQTTINQAGSRAGTANDVALSAILNHSIGRRYRGGHPKTFWPWGVEADLATNNSWSGTFQANAVTHWNAFQAAVIGATSGGTTITNLVSVSYYNGFTVVTNPITHRARNVPTLRGTPVVDVVTNTQCNLIPGIQRRRIQR